MNFIFPHHKLTACLLVVLLSMLTANSLVAQTDSCTVTSIISTQGERILIPGGGNASVSLRNDHDGNSNYIYVTTRQERDAYIITGFLDSTTLAYTAAEVAGEAVIVWGFSYSGEILAQIGDDVITTRFATGCYNISRNCVMVFTDEEPALGTAVNCGDTPGTINITGAPNVRFVIYDSVDLSDSLTTVTTDADGNAQVSYLTNDDTEDYVVQADNGEVIAFNCPGLTVMAPIQIVKVECTDTTRMVTIQGNSGASYTVYDDEERTMSLGTATAGLSGEVVISYIVSSANPFTDIDFLIPASNPQGIPLRFNCTGAFQDDDTVDALQTDDDETATANVALLASIYPNPAVGNINLQLENVPADGLEVLIFNQYGKAVQREVIAPTQRGMITLPVLNAAKSGLYFVRIIGASFSKEMSLRKL